MSASAFGARLPADPTLDDLAAMAEADGYGHRYEMSPEGILSIMPPAGGAHAVIASKLIGWFLGHGWSPELVLQNCGLRIVTEDGVGGRVPDLTVWSGPPSGAVWAAVDGLLLVIEIISPGSATIDSVIKKDEYARAGILRYWIVNGGAGNMVTVFRLAPDGYRPTLPAPQPLARLLNTAPAQHLD